MKTSKINIKTRFSDLDTQRHVTSRTYEDFFLEGRMLQLFELGISKDELLNSRNQFLTEKFKIFFSKEQGLHSELDIISKLEINDKHELFWIQEAFETGTETKVCVSKTKGKFLQEIPIFNLSPPNSIDEQSSFKEIEHFSKSCDQISREMFMLFSDRGMFYEYNNSSLLRLLEESRWIFSQEIGLTEKPIHELDTITFFMGVDLKVTRIPFSGEKLLTKVWIHKIEKFRLYMRIDILRESDGEVLISAIEEQLIVSLSKRRPRKANDLFIEKVQKFIEYPN
jgi:acyl-CoA thioesterase FadM